MCHDVPRRQQTIAVAMSAVIVMILVIATMVMIPLVMITLIAPSMILEGTKRATSVKRATSAPAEGPAYGLDFARRCEFTLRALRPRK